MRLTYQLRAASAAPLALLIVVCGCGSSAPHTPARSTLTSKSPGPISSRKASPHALRAYVRDWETSWRRLGSDLGRGGDGDDAFSDTPDASWEAARRSYELAATAYRHDERRLGKLVPPPAMRGAHDAYVAAVRRQEMRFQTLADAFGGTDPQAMEQALEALEASQLKFDRDGAQWERGVIAACKATGVRIPRFVRLELVSNGQRTPNG